jgi:hypothetical protein
MSSGYPRLYIGKASLELKKRVSFPIYQVTDDTIKDFLAYYATIFKMDHPLVIEDLSYLRFESQSFLLKFLEDSSLNIILLASEDNIIPTILSRMSLVYKLTDRVMSQFLSSIQAYEELSDIDQDTHYFTYLKKQMQLSPITYYYDVLLSNHSNKQKLVQFLIGK